MTTYLRVELDIVRTLGTDAALLHALILFRCRGRDGRGWVASYDDIREHIGLTRQRITKAAELLRSEARIGTAREGSRGSLRWFSEARNGIVGSPKRNSDSLYRETNPQLTPDDADASEPPQEASMPVEPEPLASVHPIDGGLFAEDTIEHREKTPGEWANECRNAWVGAYAAAHSRPHPSYRDKAFGQIRTMVKACEIPDDYRDAVRASQEAGAAGEWAVGNWLGVRPQSRQQFPQRGDYVARLATGVLNGQAAIEDPAAKALGL